MFDISKGIYLLVNNFQKVYNDNIKDILGGI